MLHTIALIFDKSIHDEIFEFAKLFQSENNCEFLYEQTSTPHATLVKYRGDGNTSKKYNGGEFVVSLSGLTLLPSREGEDSGTWIEISVLIPQILRDLTQEIVTDIGSDNVVSEVGDMLRPHITICKLITQNHISLSRLHPSLLRKTNIQTRIAIGSSGEDGFAFL